MTTDIELTPLNFAVVLAAGHFLNTFLSWFIHFLQHRRVFGIPLDVIHMKAHHEPMLARTDPRAFRRYAVLGYAVWLGLIGLACLAYAWIFTPWVAVTLLAHAALMGACLFYFHHEFDNPRSWLRRFHWFRRDRTLHRIHHGRAESFARSGNYAIGGPMTGLLMDVLLGTFRQPKRRLSYSR